MGEWVSESVKGWVGGWVGGSVGGSVDYAPTYLCERRLLLLGLTITIMGLK